VHKFIAKNFKTNVNLMCDGRTDVQAHKRKIHISTNLDICPLRNGWCPLWNACCPLRNDFCPLRNATVALRRGPLRRGRIYMLPGIVVIPRISDTCFLWLLSKTIH